MRRGIAIKGGRHVESVAEGALHVKEEGVVKFGLAVWSTGLAANPLIDSISELDKDDKTHSLRINDSFNPRTKDGKVMADVYCIGDASALENKLPPTAQGASLSPFHSLTRRSSPSFSIASLTLLAPLSLALSRLAGSCMARTYPQRRGQATSAARPVQVQQPGGESAPLPPPRPARRLARRLTRSPSSPSSLSLARRRWRTWATGRRSSTAPRRTARRASSPAAQHGCSGGARISTSPCRSATWSRCATTGRRPGSEGGGSAASSLERVPYHTFPPSRLLRYEYRELVRARESLSRTARRERDVQENGLHEMRRHGRRELYMTTHLSRLRFLSCPSKSCAGPDGVERGTGYDAGSAMQASAMPETGSAALLLAMRPASRRTRATARAWPGRSRDFRRDEPQSCSRASSRSSSPCQAERARA